MSIGKEVTNRGGEKIDFLTFIFHLSDYWGLQRDSR